MSKKAMKLAIEFNRYFTSMNGVEVPARISVPRDEWRELFAVLAEQPAPVQGWKLVPVEPTEDMWKAVNKLDDEMAAGSYDGKGCSIEQAWNCLLAAAPQPAQRTWVGLTESEKSAALYDKEGMTLDYEDYAEAIEAKLKEKNT